MILVNGVYHGDPHPGNIFVSPRGEIILFDFGIVQELSQTLLNSFV
jgi:ubiquinone biosynthesis protein